MKKNIYLIFTALIVIMSVVISCNNTTKKNEENPKIKMISSDTLTLVKEINQEVFQKIVKYVKENDSYTAKGSKNVYDFLPISDDATSIHVGARRPTEQGQQMKSTDLIYLMEILPDGVWTWETRSSQEDKEVINDLNEFISTIQRL